MPDLKETTIRQIHAQFKESTLTCENLVRWYMDRINRFDKGRNGLNSIIEINPDAIDDARTVDKQIVQGIDKGLMHGIPVVIKDNINTAAPMHTRAGSLALATNIATEDAFIIKKLRDAGAIILGKANMTEFANVMTKGMPGGYSSMGGQTWCPYGEKESPSGSSSGSAVAVSANLCMVSIGTETTGSIISPAQKNGVVGIKPTAGLVSRQGILPVSKTLDTAGPMARTVEDAAIVLRAIYGPDTNDNSTENIPNEYDMNFIDQLEETSLKDVRIGINRTHASWLNEEILIYEKLYKKLEEAGAVIIDVFELKPSNCAGAIIVHELREGMNEYFADLPDDYPIKNLTDVVAFNEKYRAVHRYGQVYLEMADEKFPLGTKSPEYIQKLKEREEEIMQLDKVFLDNNLDVIFFDTMTDLPPVTGFPSTTVPVAELKNGLSLGSKWVARRFDEEKLIKIVYVVEKLTKARMIPDLTRFENKE